MIATRPYLIRAFYEWIADSDCTPHVVVNAEFPGVAVPEDYIENGQIVLNIAMQAVQNLALENSAISFQASFNGVPHDIYVPIKAVNAIYARENGRGMVFSEDEDDGDDDTDTDPDTSRTTGTKSARASHLTVVK